MVESSADEILKGADIDDVAFLVVGDPFGATTHTDLVQRAHESGIKCKVIHNASVMNAVGACGLQLYKYGHAVSIPFFTDTWQPSSWYDKIVANNQWLNGVGLHTLCLLDIKVKEQSIENMARGRLIYEPPRYMTVNQALEQLLLIESREQKGVCTRDTICVGVARLGADDQVVKVGTADELLTQDFGAPLHCLVIPGAMDDMEIDSLAQFAVN